MAIRCTFKAYERLKREQHIDTLFRTGKAFSFSPVRILYRSLPRGAELSPALAGFSVPKKKFRHSVQRHRITRQMREVWRLNKHNLYAALPVETQLHIFFIYNDTTAVDYPQIEAAMIKGIEQLQTAFKAANA